MTDILLVTNVVAFALQYLTKDALTIWGAKVRAGGMQPCAPACMRACMHACMRVPQIVPGL
jgi:hypothetical protein